jgi:multidrug efflux pump subunit AcrA (membrane-fusion protein)
MLLAAIGAVLGSCGPAAEPASREADRSQSESAPTNRVDIPDTVRRNLGMTFARVESRNVARTLRVPGRFELLPTAGREYRAPLAGRIELLVQQYQRVEQGTPLFRVDAPAWRDLAEEIVATEAKVASMGPIREAHRVHERSLAEKVRLWEARLAQLDELRKAGGGSASQFTEARATLNATQADLAEVMEKDALLQAEEQQAKARLRALAARREAILGGCACATPDAESLVVCALAPGVVQHIDITPGGLAADSGEILSVVQPDQIRLRAHALQGDLARLRDGLAVRITAPSAEGAASVPEVAGTLMLGVTADPDSRTIDLVVTPSSSAPWARAGIAASLEITLDGGETELAIPLAAVVRDGAKPILFRRDPKNPDKAIRLEADLGADDGRWIVVRSGVKEGDEVVLAGNFQLLLASGGSAPKGGHFHPDGTFHAEDH